MFIQQISNANKINNDLVNETVQDIALCTERLYNRPSCQVTKNKFGKIMRDGGHVEAMLNIYVSENIVQSHPNILNDLRSKSNNRAWWNIRTALLDNLKKTYNINASWEHVSPVKLCIKECLNAYKEMSAPAFKEWVKDSIKNRWRICLILKDENKKLSNVEKICERTSDNLVNVYTISGINKVYHVRNDLL